MRAFIVHDKLVDRRVVPVVEKEVDDVGDVLPHGYTSMRAGRPEYLDLPGEVLDIDGESVRVYGTWNVQIDATAAEVAAADQDELRVRLRPFLSRPRAEARRT